nr:hypothetical protein [Tanacetum cinerariifolium]
MEASMVALKGVWRWRGVRLTRVATKGYLVCKVVMEVVGWLLGGDKVVTSMCKEASKVKGGTKILKEIEGKMGLFESVHYRVVPRVLESCTKMDNYIEEKLWVVIVSVAATFTTKEVTLAKALAELKASKPKGKGVFIQEPSKSITTTTTISSKKSQDKGKAIMVEELVKLKRKIKLGLMKKLL